MYVHMASSSNWGEIGMDDLNDIQKIKRMKHRMNSQMEGMKGLSVYVPREDNMAYLRRYPMGYCMLCGHSHEICPLGSWWVINRPTKLLEEIIGPLSWITRCSWHRPLGTLVRKYKYT